MARALKREGKLWRRNDLQGKGRAKKSWELQSKGKAKIGVGNTRIRTATAWSGDARNCFGIVRERQEWRWQGIEENR